MTSTYTLEQYMKGQGITATSTETMKEDGKYWTELLGNGE